MSDIEEKQIEIKRCPFISSLINDNKGNIQPFIGFCIQNSCELYSKEADMCKFSAACDSIMYFLTFMGGFKNLSELYQESEEDESDEQEESEEDESEKEEING